MQRRGRLFHSSIKGAVCLMGKPSASGGKQKCGAVPTALAMDLHNMSCHVTSLSETSHDQDKISPSQPES